MQNRGFLVPYLVECAHYALKLSLGSSLHVIPSQPLLLSVFSCLYKIKGKKKINKNRCQDNRNNQNIPQRKV